MFIKQIEIAQNKMKIIPMRFTQKEVADWIKLKEEESVKD